MLKIYTDALLKSLLLWFLFLLLLLLFRCMIMNQEQWLKSLEHGLGINIGKNLNYP